MGDFNRDGKLDLAVTSITALEGLYYPGSVIILLGNGDGTFRVDGEYGVGTNPQFVYADDFNRDGKTDLAVANDWDDSVTVLLGNGDGTFGTGTNYTTGGGAASISGGDFNRDGVPDLAVLNYNTADVAVLLGKGDGTFHPATNYPGGLNNCFGITASDFNYDGRLDLAIADLSGARVQVLLGKGDGTFDSPVSVNLKANIQSVAVADFNRDGRPDLAATAYDGLVLILRNTTGDPRLDIAGRAGLLTVTWPFPSSGFILESVTNLLSTNWQAAAEARTTNQGKWQVTFPSTESARYFRLRKQ